MKLIWLIGAWLLLALLLAGTGEAGSVDLKNLPPTGGSICLDLEASKTNYPVYVSCDEVIKRATAHIDLTREQSCSQRMREAMKSVDALIGNRVGMRPDERSIYKQWDAVMKDCVRQ